MVVRRCLKKGDRVHFPNDPRDTGTVVKQIVFGTLAYVRIKWDKKTGYHDVTDATRRGKLMSLDSGFVELLDP